MHKKTVKKEEVYNFLLDISKEIAKKKSGALFVISDNKYFDDLYEPLYPQAIANTSIFQKGAKELIVKLAELDGAFLVNEEGVLHAFGARILKSKALPGYGTKHAAAVGVTSNIKPSVAILVSEENHWIKIFKDGKILVEMDSSKTPAPIMNKVVSFVTDNDTALLATAGASAAIMGFIPVVIVSGTYLAIKTASGIIKKSFGSN